MLYFGKIQICPSFNKDLRRFQCPATYRIKPLPKLADETVYKI